MPDATITVRPDGPYLVQGGFELRDSYGNAFRVSGGVAALCRCGGSSNKPFCDASHSRNGFDADTRATASPNQP
jgi:CDGSH-type Zn-finger protein